jgi:hypothetical protein
MTDPTANVAATSNKMAGASHGVCVGCGHPLAWHWCSGVTEVAITHAADRPCTCVGLTATGAAAVTASRDTLEQAISEWEGMTAPPKRFAQHLIDTGALWVLDPADPVQRGRLAKRLREIEVQAVAGIHRDDTDWAAGQLIEALRQP